MHKTVNKQFGLFGNVLGRLVDTLELDDRRRCDALAQVAAELGGASAQPLLPSPTQVRTRVISWRLQREQHPYPQDTPSGLLALAWRSVVAWPGFGALSGAALLAWSACVLVAPRALLGRLVRVNASDWVTRSARWAGGGSA